MLSNCDGYTLTYICVITLYLAVSTSVYQNSSSLAVQSRLEVIPINCIGNIVTIMLDPRTLPLVESDEFRALIAYLEPEYKPPCRQTMTTRIDVLAANRREEMQEELESMTAVAVTTDICTSIANDPYISLTVSYLTSSWEMWMPTLTNTLMDECGRR